MGGEVQGMAGWGALQCEGDMGSQDQNQGTLTGLISYAFLGSSASRTLLS